MRRLFEKNKNQLRQVRHGRIRARIVGDAEKPRLSVFRSLKSISAQIIDDLSGKTICSAKSADVAKEKAEGKKGKIASAYLVGKKIAEKAKEKNIEAVIFDRGGYKYHGRVQALADGARDGGLKF
jgi:large subunit ribosomal protein L18